MKLYTEEMFLIAAEKCEVSMIDAKHIMRYIDEYVTPIELPSDEEIEEMANRYAASKKQLKHLSNREFDLSKNDFIKASKWMKEQILKKNK